MRDSTTSGAGSKDDMNDAKAFMEMFFGITSASGSDTKGKKRDVVPSSSSSSSKPKNLGGGSKDTRSISTAASGSGSTGNQKKDKQSPFGFKQMLQDEMTLRRREVLGLVGERTLGSNPGVRQEPETPSRQERLQPKNVVPSSSSNLSRVSNNEDAMAANISSPSSTSADKPPDSRQDNQNELHEASWSCLVCTL